VVQINRPFHSIRLAVVSDRQNLLILSVMYVEQRDTEMYKEQWNTRSVTGNWTGGGGGGGVSSESMFRKDKDRNKKVYPCFLQICRLYLLLPRGSVLIKALFVLTAALGPGIYSFSNRNEYQKQKSNVSGE
jgi:hypothetical protein